MFTKVRLKNFRLFDEIEFDLTNRNNVPKHLVVVYGENGAGKSNLLSAFVLLNELLATMDVRDVYEDFLNRSAIFNDETFEMDLRQKLLSNMRDMKAIIGDCRMVGSEEPVLAEFEFSVGGNIGKYSIEFGETEIIHERLEYKLSKRRGLYFDCSSEGVYINNVIFQNREFLGDIKATARRFWGKHSLLAIVFHEMNDKSTSYGWDTISDNFADILGEFTMLSSHLGIGARRWNKISSPIAVLEQADEGQLQRNNEYQLDICELVFSQFFSAINSDIERAYYRRSYNDNKIAYQLYFKKLIAGVYRDIPFSKESTGNHQLLSVLCYLLSACFGGTVIIDEADSGIHDVLFQKVFQELIPSINGQVIMTTHNTMLMEADFARDSTYIISEDDHGCRSVRNITSYEKRTFANNNIRNKYLNGEYGGLPHVRSIDFESLLQLLSRKMTNTES